MGSELLLDILKARCPNRSDCELHFTSCLFGFRVPLGVFLPFADACRVSTAGFSLSDGYMYLLGFFDAISGVIRE
jgi:hypothetical protein